MRKSATKDISISAGNPLQAFNLPGVIINIKNESFDIIQVNAAFCELTKSDKEKIITESFLLFVHPDDSAEARRKILGLDAHVTCIYFDCRVVNSSGDNKRIYWAAAAPAKDGTLFLLGHEGDEPGASGLEPGLFKLIVTQLPYGVTILDGNHTIRWVNEAFTTITGYSGNEVIGELPGKILYGTHTLNDSDKF